MPLMRRQSLRPRQIDNYGKMPVVRSVEDLHLDDDSNNSTDAATTSRPVIHSLKDLFVEQHEEHTVKKRKKDIPIPIIDIVKDYEKDVPDNFEISNSYVRFKNHQKLDLEEIEVDLTSADMKWLTAHPLYGRSGDPRYRISLEVFNRMIDILEKASGPINPHLISYAEAIDLFRKKLRLHKAAFSGMTLCVYNYWTQLREGSSTGANKPLLRQFWPQTPLNDTNPHLVFRPREKERYKLRKHRKNDLDGYRRMCMLREDFDRVRIMMKLVRRREKYKRMFIDILDEMRLQTLYELENSVNPTAVVRVPKLPVDDERKGKKKKKKRLRDHHDEHHLSSGGIGGGINSPYKKSLNSDMAKPARVLSFMDYNARLNYGKSSVEDFTPPFPEYVKEPVPRVLPGPRRYKCRGRVGRGGRIVFDRVPLSSAHSSLMREVVAPPGLYDISSSMSMAAPLTANADSDVKQEEVVVVDGSLEDAAAANVENKEGGVVAGVVAAVKYPSITPERLNEICNVSDSEDEFLEPYLPMSTALLHTMPKPKVDKVRAVKYILKV